MYEAQEICKGVWVSGASFAQHVSFLRKLRIKGVVNLSCQKTAAQDYSQFKVLSIYIEDEPNQQIIQHFPAINQFIHSCLPANVLLHCKAGISRSGAAAAAFLMWRFKLDLSRSLLVCRVKRKEIRPNEGFLRQLQEWQSRLQSNL